MKASFFSLVLLLVAAAIVSAGCSAPSANSPVPATTGTPSVIAPVQTADGQYASLSRFVDSAEAYAKQSGRDAALTEFNNLSGTFTEGDRYIFAYGMDGTTLAWPYQPGMLGTNRANVTDTNGVMHIRRMIELAGEGGGWVYYVTKNPAHNNSEELKLTYVRPVDSTWFVGSGVYLSEIPAIFTPAEKDQLVERVRQARTYAQANGAAKAIRDFNDRNGTFASGTRYIYAYGFNGTTLALPFQPELIGTDRLDFADTYGVKVIRQQISLCRNGGGFYYLHYYNPDTGKPGLKFNYVEPVDDTWFVGSGIYTDRQ